MLLLFPFIVLRGLIPCRSQRDALQPAGATGHHPHVRLQASINMNGERASHAGEA
jgi:hypothetical protein